MAQGLIAISDTVNPEGAAIKRAEYNAKRRRAAHLSNHYVDSGRALEADAREHLKKIPEDTRDFTQRFFGAPLPGRSALDRTRLRQGSAGQGAGT